MWTICSKTKEYSPEESSKDSRSTRPKELGLQRKFERPEWPAQEMAKPKMVQRPILTIVGAGLFAPCSKASLETGAYILTWGIGLVGLYPHIKTVSSRKKGAGKNGLTIVF